QERATRLLLPPGVSASALPVLAARALRALVDGYMAVLLPAYLLAIGQSTLQVGVTATATMLGSALTTLAVGAWGHRFHSRRLLQGAALLMAATAAVIGGVRAVFLLYGGVGLVIWWLYRRRLADPAAAAHTYAPLGPSRRVVVRLAALFSVDAFAGGLIVNALLALWLLQRFGLSLAQTGAFFFWAGLLSAASQLAAPRVAKRIGLLNTMALTHIPATICLVLPALAQALR